jgi:hypothetical protein
MEFTSFEQAKRSIREIKGLLLEGQDKFLFDSIKLTPKNSIIVEVGSFVGRSTTAIALACVGTARHIHCFDTWEGVEDGFAIDHWNNYLKEYGYDKCNNFFDIWTNNLKVNDLLKYVTPHMGLSENTLKQIDFDVNLAFIDGCHHYEATHSDFELLYPKVVSNGFILLHDVNDFYEGPAKVWYDALNSNRLYNPTGVGSLKRGTKPKI